MIYQILGLTLFLGQFFIFIIFYKNLDCPKKSFIVLLEHITRDQNEAKITQLCWNRKIVSRTDKSNKYAKINGTSIRVRVKF